MVRPPLTVIDSDLSEEFRAREWQRAGERQHMVLYIL